MTELKKIGSLWPGKQAGGAWDINGISPTLKTPSGGYSEPIIIENQNELFEGGNEMTIVIDSKNSFGKPKIFDDIHPTCLGTHYKEPTKLIEDGEYMKKLKVNDLFCGAGGMAYGFKQAGFETAGAWDFDKYAVQAYSHNVDSVVKQADITQMNWNDMPLADVWTFGFPCQDLSIAGKQAGLFEGKRSGLFFEVMRLLDEGIESDINSLPSIIMAENVKGLKPYLNVLEDEYKKRGYKMYYTLYNSKFWGLAQNRERYFVVGVHESIDQEFKFPVQQEDYIPRLSAFLDPVVDGKYYIDYLKAAKIIEQAKMKIELKETHSCITPERVEKMQNGRRAKENEEEMFTITAQDKHGIIEKEQPKIINLGNTNPSGRGMNGNVIHQDGITGALTTNKGEGIKVAVKKIGKIEEWGQKGDVVSTEGISGTFLATDYKTPKLIGYPTTKDGVSYNLQTKNRFPEGMENGECTAVIENHYRVRKLTEREYLRLQGFPEDFEIVCSASQTYKQAGNAVSVPVARAIAERIKMFLLSL